MTDQNLTPEAVERWRAPICQLKDGPITEEVVRARDYDALAQQNAALQAEVERLTKERDAQYEENVNRIAMQAKAEAERDEARSMLAEAERDMRQRAADDMLHFDYDGAGRKLADRILALPLKHADWENDAARRAAQTEGGA